MPWSTQDDFSYLSTSRGYGKSKGVVGPASIYGAFVDSNGRAVMKPTKTTDPALIDWCRGNGIREGTFWDALPYAVRYGYLSALFRRGYLTPNEFDAKVRALKADQDEATAERWLGRGRSVSDVRLSRNDPSYTVTDYLAELTERYRVGLITTDEYRRLFYLEEGAEPDMGNEYKLMNNIFASTASTISSNVSFPSFSGWTTFDQTTYYNAPLTVYGTGQVEQQQNLPAPKPAKPKAAKDDPLAWLHAQVDAMVAYGTL